MQSDDDKQAELQLCEQLVGEIIDVLGIEAEQVSDDQSALVQQIVYRARSVSPSMFEECSLRAGRPEDLTLAKAEEHADWLRAMDQRSVRFVGKLLIVAVNELRRLRAQNTVLQSAREGVRELVQRHEEYQALAEQLVSIIEHPNTITAEALLRDCMNAARALRHFNWSIPAPAPEGGEHGE